MKHQQYYTVIDTEEMPNVISTCVEDFPTLSEWKWIESVESLYEAFLERIVYEDNDWYGFPCVYAYIDDVWIGTYNTQWGCACIVTDFKE